MKGLLGRGAEGTIKFFDMFDKFFDCINVKYIVSKHSKMPSSHHIKAEMTFDWRCMAV